MKSERDIFKISSEISEAETLSSAFYLDRGFFEDSKKKIFSRSWQLADWSVHEKALRPRVFLEGFVDAPVLISKTGESLHCLSNVCTHRGKILVEKDTDSCRTIRCGYHGRTFSLDGRFITMPEFEETKNFPSESDSLEKIPCEEWEDFVFVSLKPMFPFADVFSEVRNRTPDFDFERLVFVREKTYEVKAHWALYCENYLEGFHIPYLHKSLNKEIDYGNYKTETFRFSSLQTGFDDQGNVGARYFFIFPNLMFNFYPWGLSINIVQPVKPDHTKIKYLTFVNDKSKLNLGAGADLETVEEEDKAVVESVQKGIRSMFYDRGRYSPTRELGTHHFHRLICEFMSR